jgi:hypothetical protein
VRRMARSAMARGDWETAANFEEQAILAEHQAALTAQALSNQHAPLHKRSPACTNKGRREGYLCNAV